MSEASEWLGRERAVEADKPTFVVPRDGTVHGGFTAAFEATGAGIVVHFEGALLARDARALAEWLLDVFSEGGSAPDAPVAPPSEAPPAKEEM